MLRLFVLQEYITHVDPLSQLGLSSDSVEGYNIGEIHRPSLARAAHTPELLPCGYLVGDSNIINIQLRGTSTSYSPTYYSLLSRMKTSYRDIVNKILYLSQVGIHI